MAKIPDIFPVKISREFIMKLLQDAVGVSVGPVGVSGGLAGGAGGGRGCRWQPGSRLALSRHNFSTSHSFNH